MDILKKIDMDDSSAGVLISDNICNHPSFSFRGFFQNEGIELLFFLPLSFTILHKSWNAVLHMYCKAVHRTDINWSSVDNLCVQFIARLIRALFLEYYADSLCRHQKSCMGSSSQVFCRWFVACLLRVDLLESYKFTLDKDFYSHFVQDFCG
ncbi:hypothetical protein NPIL_18641 [Nephila pilipes]|uniref:Uncharacterized protein n=1 Tax=Nephila pilipes TaxID=299642 RepID=A0A8X6U385_NEPPI|nr:hypothetical protein NPIL_18641 [Nephila pilipes]